VSRSSKRRQAKAVGFVFFLVVLAAGLLLGTQSSLTLERNTAGAVTAVNAWRFAGVPLIRRSVNGLREVRLAPMELNARDARSTAYYDMWGRRVIPERVVLIGDMQLEYPYREDVSLIRSFLTNTRNDRLQLTQPLDIRRKVSSYVLLTLAALVVIGAVWQRVAGRDPLSGAPRKVRPPPPAYGGAVFVGAIVALIWFFTAGHRLFGPLSTRKVQLLQQSASGDDTAGVTRAVEQGVFVDARDGQDMTALMLAARTGAGRAVGALLEAGANVGLRDLNDNTALMWAIQTKHPDVAVRLLDSGSGVEDADANGRTALHLAAQAGNAALVRRVLQAGARVNQPDAHGWTPLFFAAAASDADSIAALLDAGATAATKLPDGRTAVDLVQADASLRTLLTTPRTVERP
jgi:hypothetical protein